MSNSIGERAGRLSCCKNESKEFNSSKKEVKERTKRKGNKSDTNG